MQNLIYGMLAVPLLFVLAALSRRLSNNVLHALNRLTAAIVSIIFSYMLAMRTPGQIFSEGYFYLDALSFWMLLIVVTLYFASSWVSKSYLVREDKRGYLARTPDQIGRYYALFQLFVWTMLAVLTLKNLGLMWVGIEATTLVSALLVSFKFTRSALEATWKYIMVCTVGICLALLGTIILYYAQFAALGTEKALNWPWLSQNAGLLNPSLVKLSFLFIFVGYGTKIGLAPMHTWLPDAYSEAPSLISGLLSGALCTCALYVLIRNLIIAVPAVGVSYVTTLFSFFALLTVAVAVPFVVVQRDIKRLLAYSSMENIGIMLVGLSVFTSISLGATLLHMANHALIKFVLFYIAGTIVQEFQTKNMMRIHGLSQEAPHTATFLLLGMIGILGMPPFGLFYSKFSIIMSLFAGGHYLLGTVMVTLLAGVLIGILYHVMRMLSGRAKRKACSDLLDHTDAPLLAAMLFASMLLGVFWQQIPVLNNLLVEASRIIAGGIQ